MLFIYFFFFQAEDGIRDYKVTGVQTCLFRSRDRAQVRFAREDGQAVHRMKIVLAGRVVAPEDVAPAVAVEVADAGDLPALVRDRANVAFTADRGAVH